MQPAHSVPLVFPVTARDISDSREAAVDINVFHYVHGQANGYMLREKAKMLAVKLLGELRPCTACSMAK